MYCVKGFRRRKKRRYVVVIVITIVIFFFLSLFFNKLISDNLNKKTADEECIDKVVKEVVGISSQSLEGNIWGSGVVISKNGYILTNEHVIGEDNKCRVILNDDSEIDAKTVWSNSSIDLAILKVDKTFDSEAIILDSDSFHLGQDVYAIGNPINEDFKNSVSKGIISGLNRNIEFEENGRKFYLNGLIQTDASINLGNSGGALIDSSGFLIGISTIKITSAENIGFAIPAYVVKPIIDKINATGNFKEPRLGISVYDKYSIEKINKKLSTNNGIYIAEVNPDSTSEKYGLRAGDIIEKINDKECNLVFDLRKRHL